MPTKRSYRKRQRKDQEVPAWAKHMLATGERPQRGSGDFDAFAAWKYFGDHVPGLPNADSEEGMRLANATMTED